MKKILILIVGASGVGKDTLLKELKKYLSANFIKRYITRQPDINESNYYVSKEAFKVLENSAYFISSWSAHNNFYGISKNSIKEGLNIISVSRAVIKNFEDIFEEVYTINITLNKKILKQRLLNRKRESLNEIENRLNRDYKIINAKNLIEFENNKEVNESTKELKNLIEAILNKTTK